MRAWRVSATLAVVAIVGVGVGTQEGTEQEVLQAQAERFRAQSAGDWRTVERRLAEELWYCRASGNCDSKLSYLDPERRIVTGSMKPLNMKARVYGDVAMVWGWWAQEIGAGGQHWSLIEVWVKRDGRWQLAKFQSTDAPNDPRPFSLAQFGSGSLAHRCSECTEPPGNPSARYRSQGDKSVVKLPGWDPFTWRWRQSYQFGTRGEAERAVLQAQAERYRATVAGDTKALDRVIANEFQYCPADGLDNVFDDKTTYLQVMAGKPVHGRTLKFLSLWGEEMRPNVYGNVATVIGRLHQLTTSGTSTKPIDENFLILDVYVNRDGRWQLAGSQETYLPGWSPTRCAACKPS